MAVRLGWEPGSVASGPEGDGPDRSMLGVATATVRMMRRLLVPALAATAAFAVPVLIPTSPVVASPATPSERVCFDVSGAPGSVAIVNLTPIGATASGSGQLVSSDVSVPPEASNVNFGPGTVDPNVALAAVGADGRVCFVNSVHGNVHIIADDLGALSAAAFGPTSTGAPLRRVDTRTGLGGGIIAASERRCFDVGGVAGDVALVNLTPVGANRAGFGVLVPDDASIQTPTASNVNFGPGTVDPNVALATVGASGKVCFVNSVHGPVHLVADELGTVRRAAAKPAAPGGVPIRLVDTRRGIGGGMVVPSGRLCFTVAGAPGDLAFVNLTPVDATRAGFGQLVSSGLTGPAATSNVNFDTRTFDPNVAAAVIGTDGQVCFVNSVHAAVHLVADHLISVAGSAYTAPGPTGSPVRAIDTRPSGSVVYSNTSVLPTAIDCLTSEACVASVGNAPVQSLTINAAGAATLGPVPAATTPATPPTRSTAVECALLDKCFAIGTSNEPINGRRQATLHVTTNRGAAWTAATLPRAIDALNDFTCASSLRCLAVGYVDNAGSLEGVVLVTGNGGTSWSELTVPSTVDQIEAVDCPSATLCLMIGKDGNAPAGSEPSRILRSTNAGATWGTVALPTGFPTEINCPTETTCLAFTGGLSAARHLSTDGGVSWTSQPMVGPRVDHVECPAIDRCVATPGSPDSPRPGTTGVLVSTDLFATWTTRFVPSGATGTGSRSVDVSCSSTAACSVTGWYDGGAAGGFVSRFSLD